ncbi:MAG: SDR family NAD(P)-dependent oxidoreductase [Rickettsiales bacterium]
MTKTILITGASAGIGKATAELLAREKDVRLILTARRADKLKEVAETLPCETHLLTLDVRDKAAALAAVRGLPDAWKNIDVLVNNAGLALGLEPFDQANVDDWQVMVETNILGLLTLSREILPGMKARGRGHVVNLSSIAGTYHYPGAHVYGASKAFVTYLSLAMRSDLLGTPIRVTNIEPGMVDTEFSMVRFKGNEQRADAVYEGTEPLHAEDIAETIRWALAQPGHVNINRIEVMATCQAPGGPKVWREIK